MDPVQAFLQANALTPPAFAPTSRYYGIPTSQLVQADGRGASAGPPQAGPHPLGGSTAVPGGRGAVRTVVFVQRRFLPPPENFALLQTVSIVAGDRLDNLAAQHIGDPEQAWRLCDANRAMQPEALVVNVAATLAITLPEGVPGAGDAG